MSLNTAVEPLTRWRLFLVDLMAGWYSQLSALARSLADTDAPSPEVDLTWGETDTNHSFAAKCAHAYDITGAYHDIELNFPEDAVLRTQLQMPKTSRHNLVQALRFELGRLSPLDPQDVYFDFKTSSEKSAKTQTVDLRIVKRAEIDQAVRLCREAGLSVASITFENDSRPADWRLFPVDKLALTLSLWRQWNIAVLAAAALLLGLFLIVACYLRSVEIGEQLSAQLSTAQERAAIVEHLQAKVRSALAESRFLAEQKRGPMLVSLLAELSQTLPEDTWISQLSIDGGKLQLQGYSRAASNLIGLLDRSALFVNAQFTAPLTQDTRSSFERFDLSVDVKARQP